MTTVHCSAKSCQPDWPEVLASDFEREMPASRVCMIGNKQEWQSDLCPLLWVTKGPLFGLPFFLISCPGLKDGIGFGVMWFRFLSSSCYLVWIRSFFGTISPSVKWGGQYHAIGFAVRLPEVLTSTWYHRIPGYVMFMKTIGHLCLATSWLYGSVAWLYFFLII